VEVTLNGGTMRLIELVHSAQKCIENANRKYPKQLYIGEFGYRQGSKVSLNFVRDLLSMVSPEQQLKSEVRIENPFASLSPSRATSSSSFHANNGKKHLPLLPLLSIWVWEFEPQSSTLSVEASRDSWLVKELAQANRLSLISRERERERDGERVRLKEYGKLHT
jgi:hypothetical protein